MLPSILYSWFEGVFSMTTPALARRTLGAATAAGVWGVAIELTKHVAKSMIATLKSDGTVHSRLLKESLVAATVTAAK